MEFDLIRVELKQMPDHFQPNGVLFQTKDLGCLGEVYTISSAGRLTDTIYGDNHYQGSINFYTETPLGDWHEYFAEFKEGQLQGIFSVGKSK